MKRARSKEQGIGRQKNTQNTSEKKNKEKRGEIFKEERADTKRQQS